MSVRRAASVPAAPVAASSGRLRDVLAAGLGTASASNMRVQEAISTTTFKYIGQLNHYLRANLQYNGNDFLMISGEEGFTLHFGEDVVPLNVTFAFDANGVKCFLVYTTDEKGMYVYQLQHTALHPWGMKPSYY